MGLNPLRQSYFTTPAPDGAAAVTQAVDRATGPPAFNAPGANPRVLRGALVHGPSSDGAFTDVRTQPQYTGTSLLNNSPLPLLIAALHSRGLAIEDCVGLQPREALAKSSSVAAALADGDSSTAEDESSDGGGPDQPTTSAASAPPADDSR